MADALTAFPPRPLRARPPLKGAFDFWSWLGILMVAGMLAAALIWVAPVLVTDWQVRSNAVPIRGAHLSDGSCNSKLFINTCDATLTAPGGAGSISRTVHYVFGSFTLGDFTATVVADPRHPEWLTTDLGLDYFWDRVVCLVLAVGLLTAGIFFGIKGMMRAARTRTWWRKATLVPTPLKLVALQKVRGGTAWTVCAEGGAPVRWTVPRRAKPFTLGANGVVLGLVTRGNGSAIMPLDSALRWVDLSPQERAAILAAKAG